MIPSEQLLPSDHLVSSLPDRPSSLARLYAKTLLQEPPLFMPSDAIHNPRSNARAAYLEQFWRENPSAYVAWKAGGIMEKDTDNIARHNVVAGVLAQELCTLLHMNPDTTNRVVQAALIHDATKLRENEQLDRAINQRKGISKQLLDDVKHQDNLWLTQLGYDQHVIHLSGANVPKKPENIDFQARTAQVGSEKALSETAKTIALSMSLEEKIIWYVDAILYDELPVGVEFRMTLGRGHGKLEKSPRELRNQALNNALSSHYGVNYFDLQEAIGAHVESFLIAAITEKHPQLHYIGQKTTLPTFLDERLEQKAKQHTVSPTYRRTKQR